MSLMCERRHLIVLSREQACFAVEHLLVLGNLALINDFKNDAVYGRFFFSLREKHFRRSKRKDACAHTRVIEYLGKGLPILESALIVGASLRDD